MGSACDSADFMMQAWACMPNYAGFGPKGVPTLEREWRLKIYFMGNDPTRHLERAMRDFPGLASQPYPGGRPGIP